MQLICTMALVALLFAVCVLHSWETQGSTAVTPVFVKQGDNVLLEVKEHVKLTEEEDFFWIFSQTYSIVKLSYDNKIIIFKNYSQRAEFSDQNRSLLLKNLQQADSGPYVAQVIGEREQNIAEHKVIVQNPVTPVKLSVDSVSNSIESCNLTVSCSTERSHISSTFRCDTQTCNQMGVEQPEDTTSGSSLHVYLLNDHIICNHSNQVNWTKDLKKIRTLCPLNTVPNGRLRMGIIVSCLVVIFVFAGIPIYQQCKNSKCCSSAQSPNQNATEDASGLSPNYLCCGLISN